jgi:hypothetical protein
MTTAFAIQGPSMILSYADDSTDIREIIPQDGLGIPNALFIFNPDTANVIVVAAGLTEGDVDAVVPTSGINGEGVVVGPNSSVLITIPQARNAAGSLFVAVAGVSATGNVYITPGAV